MSKPGPPVPAAMVRIDSFRKCGCHITITGKFASVLACKNHSKPSGLYFYTRSRETYRQTSRPKAEVVECR